MIKSKNYMSGSEWWLNSENLSFSSIVRQSKVPENLSRYDSESIKKINSILMPVNRYVLELYPRPDVIKIDNNIVTFRQRTHAEIWIEDRGDGVLYAVDKCHQRQFYPSEHNIKIENCFLATYKFYVPWFINKNINIEIDSVHDEPTPFYVNKKTFIGNYIDISTPYVDTEFVDFKIKNFDRYYLKENYGIISKNTAMYDMSVLLSDEEILGLRKEYGK